MFEDYSHISPIEPSAVGGRKITGVIHHVLSNHDFGSEGTRVYGKVAGGYS